MLKSQRFSNFLGFGDGKKYPFGEYVHSQGMNKSPNGIMPLWKVLASTDDSSLTDLEGGNFFAQAIPGSSKYVYLADTLGSIFQSLNGVGAWTLAYKPGQTTFGNGLIGDQTGKLLYPMTRYLGRYDGTADYTTGTIAVTNGSPNVVGTGTTFTSGMVDRMIVIGGVWYRITAFTDATHIALATNYAGTTASGVSYAIKVGWKDKYKDFGASSLPNNSDYRVGDTYEDWVAIPNGNKVALLNVTDESFNTAGFELPSNFLIPILKSGRTGILIGANVGNRCALILWEPNTLRSLTPWIWKNGNVQSIVPYNGDWIVVTNREILITNGYTAQKLAPVPDDLANVNYLSVHPQGVEIMNNYLVIGNKTSLTNRIRSGYWLLGLASLLWEYAPVSTGGTFSDGGSVGPIFFDSNFTTHVAYATNKPNKNFIGTLNNSQPSSAYLITQPLGEGNGQKVGIGAKLNLGISPYQTASYPITFDIAVKIYNFKRPLWTYAQQKVLASVNHNKITVDGTVSGLNNAEVGDEVTVMEGVNAGQTAHIVSITGTNSATEVWTLDRDFSGFTEQDVFIQVMPFQLMKQYSFTDLLELKEIYFNCRNKIKGQKFLLKILLENIGNVPPELLEGEFIYDDLGLITTN